MSAAVLEQLAIKRACAEHLKKTTAKLKAKYDAQTKELADARAEAASWRKMHESQAAIKELNKLRKDMAQAAASTNEAIRRLKEEAAEAIHLANVRMRHDVNRSVASRVHSSPAAFDEYNKVIHDPEFPHMLRAAQADPPSWNTPA